jgi:hypothetical protein
MQRKLSSPKRRKIIPEARELFYLCRENNKTPPRGNFCAGELFISLYLLFFAFFLYRLNSFFGRFLVFRVVAEIFFF